MAAVDDLQPRLLKEFVQPLERPHVMAAIVIDDPLPYRIVLYPRQPRRAAWRCRFGAVDRQTQVARTPEASGGRAQDLVDHRAVLNGRNEAQAATAAGARATGFLYPYRRCAKTEKIGANVEFRSWVLRARTTLFPLCASSASPLLGPRQLHGRDVCRGGAREQITVHVVRVVEVGGANSARHQMDAEQV